MPSSEDIEIPLLLDAIYQRFHYDFRQYSMASVRRRLAQARAQLGCQTISGLQERLLNGARRGVVVVEDPWAPSRR